MSELAGTWRMVGAKAWDDKGNELPAPYGGKPLARVVFGADGRMAAMVIDVQNRDYGGYSGTYTYDGKQLVTRVDCAPDKNRIGSDQIRGVRFEGDLLVLRPPPRVQGGIVEQRELTWEKISGV